MDAGGSRVMEVGKRKCRLRRVGACGRLYKWEEGRKHLESFIPLRKGRDVHHIAHHIAHSCMDWFGE